MENPSSYPPEKFDDRLIVERLLSNQIACPIERELAKLYSDFNIEVKDLVSLGIDLAQFGIALEGSQLWELVPSMQAKKGLQEGTLELMSRGGNTFQTTARETAGKRAFAENIPVRPHQGQRLASLLAATGTLHSILVTYAEADQQRRILEKLEEIRIAQKADRDGALIARAKEAFSIIRTCEQADSEDQRLLGIRGHLNELQERFLAEALAILSSFEKSNWPFLNGLNPMGASNSERATAILKDVFENLSAANKAFQVQQVIFSWLEKYREADFLAADFSNSIQIQYDRAAEMFQNLPFSPQSKTLSETDARAFFESMKSNAVAVSTLLESRTRNRPSSIENELFRERQQSD